MASTVPKVSFSLHSLRLVNEGVSATLTEASGWATSMVTGGGTTDAVDETAEDGAVASLFFSRSSSSFLRRSRLWLELQTVRGDAGE